MSIDTIGNFLTLIRNGVSRSKPVILAPHSNLKEEIAIILKQEGYIKDFVTTSEDNFKNLKIILKYEQGESVIHEITRISKPGRRVYCGASEFTPVIGGLGVSILTTPKGLMTDKQAKQLNLGGEVICQVW